MDKEIKYELLKKSELIEVCKKLDAELNDLKHLASAIDAKELEIKKQKEKYEGLLTEKNEQLKNRPEDPKVKAQLDANKAQIDNLQKEYNSLSRLASDIYEFAHTLHDRNIAVLKVLEGTTDNAASLSEQADKTLTVFKQFLPGKE